MKKLFALLSALVLTAVSCACFAEETAASDKEAIEAALNLRNNPDQEWTWKSAADAWALTPVTAVTNPVIDNEEGVSVCVPGAYVKGIDTDGDGKADVTGHQHQRPDIYGGHRARDPEYRRGGLRQQQQHNRRDHLCRSGLHQRGLRQPRQAGQLYQ